MEIRCESESRGTRIHRARGVGPDPLRWGEVLELLSASTASRAALTDCLTAAPWRAFFWEAVPVSRDTLERTFEFALVESPTLARVTPDPQPFREHLRADPQDDPVVGFDNLGGDARLIVPRPLGAPDPYAHLADFVRGAPADQVDALWLRTARELEARLAESGRPCWVSTSGLGVYWVHVRLDERPKYYQHAPYRAWPPTSGTS